jgi:hypothetical protein
MGITDILTVMRVSRYKYIMCDPEGVPDYPDSPTHSMRGMICRVVVHPWYQYRSGLFFKQYHIPV